MGFQIYLYFIHTYSTEHTILTHVKIAYIINIYKSLT
jgi:hypothetical protein